MTEATPKVPDVAGAFIGWKGWILDIQTLTLFSPRLPCKWPAREELIAKCLTNQSWEPKRNHQSPYQGGCNCGIYAVTNPQVARDYVVPAPALAEFTKMTDWMHVFGLVALWGRVIPGQVGWRAEKAYPQRLWITGKTVTSFDSHGHVQMTSRTTKNRGKVIARQLAAKYGIPVKFAKDLTEFDGDPLDPPLPPENWMPLRHGPWQEG